MLTSRFFWLAAVLAAIFTSPVWGQGRTDNIVNDTVIGPGGGTFNPFWSQAILTMNNNGDIAFRSGESGLSAGMFFYDAASNSFSGIARIGDSVGGNGTVNILSTPRLNDQQDVAFAANLSSTNGGSSDDTALFGWNPASGSFQVYVREGQVINGATTAQSVVESGLYGLFDTGEIGFGVSLNGASSATDYGVYKTNAGSFVETYRKGAGSTGTETFLSGPRPNFNGTGSQLIAPFDTASTTYLMHDMQTVATASNIPGSGDFYLFTKTTIADDGTVYFSAEETSSSNHDLYISVAPGSWQTLAAQDAFAPGGTGTEKYGAFSDVGMVTGGGQMAFRNTLDSGKQAIFKSTASGIVRIATEGDVAPDGNGNFGNFDTLTSTSSSGYAINETGVVAFRNVLDNTSGGGADDSGVFLSDGIDLVTAIRDGDTINGSVVQSYLWNGGRESDHQSSTAFNNFGQIAYRAQIGGEWVINTFTPDLHFRSATSGNWDDNMNWTLSLNPDYVHDVFIDPSNADIAVTGPSAPLTMINSLQIGGGQNRAMLVLTKGTTIDVMDGTSILANGTLAGEGTLFGDTISLGVIAPGSSAGTIGFENLELSVGSMLEIELGGLVDSEYDRILVSGDATLDGGLSVSLLPGFSLTGGMTFDFLNVGGSYSGMLGGFSDGDLVGNYGGTDLYISYGSGGVSLFSSVPEPGSALMLGVVAVGVSLRRRRSIG